MYLYREYMPSFWTGRRFFWTTAGGAYLATRYLIELGHRRIVGVFKSDDTQGQQRHKGVCAGTAGSGNCV